MREIDPDAGPLVVLSRLRTLGLRLRTRPETAPLATDVDAARATVAVRHEAWQAAYDARLAATGALVFADDSEDAVIADVARRAKVLVDGQLKSPVYLRLFSAAASSLTKGLADDPQRVLATHLAQVLATDPAYATLADRVPELTRSRADVVAAITARDGLLVGEAAAWNELQLAEQAGREVYRDT